MYQAIITGIVLYVHVEGGERNLRKAFLVKLKCDRADRNCIGTICENQTYRRPESWSVFSSLVALNPLVGPKMSAFKILLQSSLYCQFACILPRLKPFNFNRFGLKSSK